MPDVSGKLTFLGIIDEKSRTCTLEFCVIATESSTGSAAGAAFAKILQVIVARTKRLLAEKRIVMIMTVVESVDLRDEMGRKILRRV